MPWRTSTVEQARAKLIEDYESGCYSVSELAKLHGVSRQWATELLQRAEQDRAAACLSRSRRPLHSPNATPSEVIEAMMAFQRKHPSLSPRKIVQRLGKLHPEMHFPAPSVAYTIFGRLGIIAPARRARQHRWGHPGRVDLSAFQPSEVVSGDFKGQFKTGDGIYTYPLTIADLVSRHLHAIDGYGSTAYAGVFRSFERVFEECGKPLIVLTDNGTPFASSGLGRISRFHIWLMRHSIRPMTIEPGHPEQNGAHERMHRTLKRATAMPPAATRAKQQLRFNAFRQEYNHDRPHDALQGRTPAEVFCRSPRRYIRKVAPFDYPKHLELRRVSPSGTIRWRGDALFLTEVLAGEWIALDEVHDQVWIVWFRQFEIARLDEANRRFVT